MQTNYVTRELNFVGYNDQNPPEFIPKGYLADALNCLIRTPGEIVKRTGYSLLGSDIGQNTACQGLKGVQFADGTKIIFTVFNGNIYLSSGGNFSLATGGAGVLDTTAQVDIVAANNAVYFFDGISTVPKSDSAGNISTISAIPKGKYARWFHNQLHVAGISGTPNKLKSSDIGAPETFTGGNSSDLDVNPNDGDVITGLNELKDALIISKRNNFWSATGFGTTALTLSGIVSNVSGFGAICHRSMVNTGNDLLYVTFLADRPIIRALSRTIYGTIIDGGIVSNAIEGTMGGLNKTQLTSVAAVFDGKFAWFAVANGSSTTNNLCLVYNTDSKGWMRQTGINATVFISFAISNQPQLYFGESTAHSKVYVFDTSTADNGVAINFSIKTRRYGGEEADIKKKYRWLYLTAKETGNYPLTVDYSIDGFTFSNLGTMTLTGSGSVFNMITLDVSRLGATDLNKKRFTIPKSRNYYVQFNMYDTSTVSAITIRNWELYFQKKYPISTVHI